MACAAAGACGSPRPGSGCCRTPSAAWRSPRRRSRRYGPSAAGRGCGHATFAPSVVPRVLDALAPLDVEVACTDAHSEEVVRGLDDHTVDIGFVVPCPYPHTLTVEPLLTDPVICVARPGHALATGGPLRIRDLAAHPVACTTWGDGAARFLDLLRAAPVPSTRLYPVSPAGTVASLARRGSHVGVLTRSTVGPDLAAGALVELPVADLPRWELTLALAHRAQDAATAPVRALRAALLDAG